MKVKALFKDLPVEIHGSKEASLTGISEDSRRIAPGNLFLAKKGKTYDGTKFLNDAVKNGASAILTDIYDPFLGKITQIIHPDPSALAPVLADRFYKKPSSELNLIGITGTNGKTTTTYLIKHILESEHILCGLIGTVEILIGKSRYDSTHTTPDVLSVQKLLREMRNHQCQAAVMEVTAHALSQKRVENVRFSFALFSNLTRDHLDYYETMEAYGNAKRELFRMLDEKACAILNADSPHSSLMKEGCKARIMTYGMENPADVKASALELTAQGMSFNIEYQGQKVPFTSKLIGRFNVYNILSAVSVSLGMGFTLEQLKEKVASFRTVPGRLQRVSSKSSVFVDYAHTPDALLNVLQTLKELRKGKILTVFGCGGNRDRTKRPLMARIAEEYSDVSIVTSDNPRNEAPEAIVEEIAKGFQGKNHIVEIDRKEAIRKAVSMAGKDDIVLIAGKGHEKTQIFAHRTIPFDDVEIAREFLGS